MYFIYTLTAFIVFFHLLNYLKKKVALFSLNSLTLPFFIFIVIQTLSTLTSIDRHTSLFGYYSRLNGGLISLLVFFLLFLILPLYLDEKLKNKIINLSLISGFIIALYGIAQHFGIDSHFWVQDVRSRVFSTLGQPNWLAAYLCILLPLSLETLKKTKYIVSPILFLCLLYTGSKTGLIAALISLGIYYFHSIFKKPFSVKTYFLPIFFVLLSLTISNPIKNLVFPPKILPSENLRSDILITPSEDIRKIVWKGSLDLWKKYPILGTGPETFAYSYYWVRPTSHNLTSEWDFLYNKVHNEYLNFLATTGLLGLLSYLGLIAFSLFQLIKSQKYHLLAAYLSILVTNFAGFSVATISLFFFLIPLFSLPNSKAVFLPKLRPLFFIFLPLVLFFIYKSICFYLADISFAQGEKENTSNQYLLSYRYFLKSYQLNPQEAIYSSRLSLSAAQIATAYTLQDSPTLAASFANSAQKLSRLALLLSPYNINLYKEKIQGLTYLATVDSAYYSQIIDTLNKIILLAPTDAKSFYLLAKFYDITKDTTKAESYYLKAIELKANYDYACFDLAKLYFDQKNYPEAKKYFELNLRYSPTNQNAIDFLKKLSSF